MKLSDNMTILLTVLLNVIKNLGTLVIFAFLAVHFNNLWIILLAALFWGGYSVKMNYKKNNEEEEKNNG